MADSQHLRGNTSFPANRTRELHSPLPKSVGQPKSLTRFFRKFLFFALFLIVIPLFPSQAPDFINQTIFTKFWELVHLLFIGVAVSYGLFCRRNVDMDIETHATSDESESYLSRVFHVSSFFEDGYDNSHGYGEKNVSQTWCPENYKGESIVDGTDESSVISEQSKTGSLNCEIGFENPRAYNENNVTQAWNSQYFPGESMVVADQSNYALNEHGESGLITSHKPLGLPIRRLGSTIRNQDSPEISNGSESSSVLTDSSNSPPTHQHINKTFGDLDPLNFENKFNETTAWHSRSGSMDVKGKAGIANHPLHFRPLSVDETQFESLKSQSFWSSESFTSQSSSMSDSPNRLSPSVTVSSELENLKMDDSGKEKNFRNSYPPASIPINGQKKLNALRLRRYTNGSLFEKNARKSFEDDLKDRSGSKKEDPLGYKGLRSGSLKLDENPANLVKALSRGKSVRTIRAREYAAEAMKVGEKSGNHTKNKVGKAASDETEAVYKGKNEMKNGDLGILSMVANKQDLENQKRKNKERSQDFAVLSKEESGSEVENFQVKSDDKTVIDGVNDPGFDPNEVDKKAGEFIAKFREQIRLQKMASIDKSRGRNHFR